MRSLLRKPVIAVLGLVALLAMTAAPAFAQFDTEYDPGTPAFERTWNRTDLPVANDDVERTWIWGPGRTEVMTEEYADSPGNMRQVQYFDKSRMEINDPDAPDDGLWYVTNGLLVVEMITGMMQVGDTAFEERSPADVQIAGDPGNEFAPTYADINNLGLRDLPADDVGDLITRSFTGDDEVVDDEAFADYGVTAAERVTVPGIDHTVASPFWEFMNSMGPVWEDGALVTENLFENAYYATGLPITPAFWSVVPVLGAEQDVLWQCFERRCLTYTPSNNEGFQVEAGNVGQHYWLWRYGDDPGPEPDYDGVYYSEINSLNDSGVVGAAMLTLEGDQLTVHIEAHGLEAEQTHAQHIHGFSDEAEEDMPAMRQATMSTCPNPELDENDDGLVDVGEGAPAYGPVLIPLEPFPTASSGGMVEYNETLTIDPAALMDPTQRVIVLHGMTVGEEYVGSLPVGCGSIVEAPTDAASYFAELGELNESGVSGSASITLDGPLMTVSLSTSGNEADMLHPQHIHGMADGSPSVCPTPELDENDDGYVDVGEGAPAYGPVLLGLTPFPTADGAGNVTYEHTFLVNLSALGNLTDRVIVTHGMTVGEEYVASMPIACGDIVEGDAPPPPPEAQTYMLEFGELNDSGVSASGTISLDGDQLHVQISAAGLEADMVHAQHIHGQDEGFAFCPGPDFDEDDNGMVEIGEGVPAYGGVVQPLFIDVDAEEYPTAGADGTVEFDMTYTVDPETIGNLADRVVVLHGLTVGEEYVPGQPVACSLIVPADADAYAAYNLSADNVLPEPPDSAGVGSAWFWHDEAGDSIYFMLSVNDVEDITASHIHLGAADEGGGVIVPLFVGLGEGESVSGFGILSTGRITDADLSGDLAGMTLADLIALFGTDEVESGAYVNVHSIEYGPGVLRDQIVAVVPE